MNEMTWKAIARGTRPQIALRVATFTVLPFEDVSIYYTKSVVCMHSFLPPGNQTIFGGLSKPEITSMFGIL